MKKPAFDGEQEIETVLGLIGPQLTEKQFKLLITEVLRAYHTRELGRISSILIECNQPNTWEQVWSRFSDNCSSKTDALHSYVHYLMAQVDGGEFTIPPA